MEGIFESYNYTLAYKDTQEDCIRQVMNDHVSLEQCYTKTLSGFADYQPNSPVLFAIICGFDLCEDRLCTMYKETFTCGDANHVKFTPKSELSESRLKLLSEVDAVKAFLCHRERLQQVDKEQEIVFSGDRAIGCFKEYNMTNLAELNGIICFQVILPLLCKYGLSEIDPIVFSNVSSALKMLGMESTALKLFGYSWSESREKISSNGRPFPERFRFILRLPNNMYPVIETAFRNGQLPLVDRIISLRPDISVRDILGLIAIGKIKDNPETLDEIKNFLDRDNAECTLDSLVIFKDIIDMLNQTKKLSDNPEFARQNIRRGK